MRIRIIMLLILGASVAGVCYAQSNAQSNAPNLDPDSSMGHESTYNSDIENATNGYNDVTTGKNSENQY